MKAQCPKILVVDNMNKTLQWDEYNCEKALENELDEQLIQVSTDSTLIVTCEVSKTLETKRTLMVWDSSTFQLIGEIDSIPNGRVKDIHISPNNKWIMQLTTSHVYVFETYKLNNTPIFEYKIWNLDEGIKATFTSDSKCIITGGVGFPMMIHNITDQSKQSMPIDCGSQLAIDIQCRGNMLFIAKVGRRISIVNTCSHKNVQSLLSRDRINQISLSNDEKTFVTIGILDTIKLWSTQTRKLIRKYGKYLDSFGGVNLSKDGQLMISNSQVDDCLLWNMPSGECIIFEEYCCPSSKYKFSQDGKFIIRNQDKRQAKIWKISDQHFKVIQ